MNSCTGSAAANIAAPAAMAQVVSLAGGCGSASLPKNETLARRMPEIQRRFAA